ncbi:MAG: hypothetical protein ACE5GX_08140 [Thermoanaerobaculia bacterium]
MLEALETLIEFMRNLIRFTSEAGPFIFLQVALMNVVLVLTLINVARLAFRSGKAAEGLDRSIDAILFWGGLTAIFGFLGQWVGLYRAANVLYDYGVADPRLVVKGIGESLNTSVAGSLAFLFAAFLWFGLRLVQQARVAARPAR